MLNDIVSGISKTLSAAFGERYEVFTEQVKQGLKPPCFIVSCVNPVNVPVVGGRSHRQSLFSVVYFPESVTSAAAECLDVQVALFAALEYIEVCGAKLRGTGMGGQLVDGTLVFMVSYNMFARMAAGKEKEPMETLINLSVKTGPEDDDNEIR
jgi:hypothetical protein